MIQFSRVRWLSTFALICGCAFQARAQSAGSVEMYSEQGQRALAQGNYAEAEAAFEKLRELEPSMAEVHANLGAIYFQERKFGPATFALRQALKLKPALPKTAALLAMSLAELGRYDESLPGLEKGFRHSTDPAVKRMCGLHLLRVYSGLRQDTRAVEVGLELNRLYPSDPEVLYHAGRIFGNFAFQSIHKLADVAPNSVWRHLAAAEAYESQGSNDQAIAEYRQVLKLDPQRPGIHYRIGRTLIARFWQAHSAEDTAEAEKEFLKELEADPTNANAAYEVGEMRRKASQLDQAQQYFEQALKYYPDFEEANLGMASVLVQQKKPDQALPHIQKAIAANSENEVSWYRLAQVQRALGNTAGQQKATAEFRRLHEKSVQSRVPKDFLSSHEVTKQEAEPNTPE